MPGNAAEITRSHHSPKMRNRAESRMRSSPRRRAQVHRRSSKRRNTRTTAHMRNHIHILHRIDGTGTGDPDLKRYARAGPVPWPCGARCERGARSCGLSPLLTDPRPRSRKSRGASSALSPPPPPPERIRQLPPSLSPGALVAPGTRAQHSTGASHGCESNCSCEFDASPILHRGLLPCPSAAVWLLQ